jgi:hypothetical protein
MAMLLAPVGPADDGPQVSLVDGRDIRQKEDLLLNVRSKMTKLHHLGDPRSRHLAEASQFGVILNRFIPQHSLKLDGKCHEPRDPQYCLFSTGGYVGARSPDHTDAGIWATTELMLNAAVGENLFEHYGKLLAEKRAEQGGAA